MWSTIGFGAACVIGAYHYWDGIWIVAVLAAASCILTFLFRERHMLLRPITAVLLGLSLGIGWFLGYDAIFMEGAKAADGKTVPVVAIATDYSYETDYGQAVEGKLTLEGKEYPALIYLNGQEALSPGDEIRGSFRLRLTRDGAQEATYHRGNGIIFLAYQKSETAVTEKETDLWRHLPAVLRRTLTERIDAFFPEDTAFFAKALLLGDRSGVDYETNTAFKLSGISHVIAVSGLHVSILFSLVYLFTLRRRISTALIGIPVMILFAAVAGFTPSITRACIMQILMMVALLFNREYDPPTALSFSALVMLVVDPLVCTSVSFQLSVGCMAGIFLFSERIKGWIDGATFWKDWKGKQFRVRIRSWLSSGISVTVSAMFFTTPLVAYYFGAVSIVGIVTNLLTLWVISSIFYGIMLVCLVSFFWGWAATAIAWIISWPIRYVLVVSKLLAGIPLSAVYTSSIYIVLWLVLCYGLLMIFLISKDRQPHVLICCGVLGLCVALGLSWMEPLMDRCRITVLDVGQGQCVLLQADGRSYLVDCGGDSDTASADLAAETLLSQGITHLDGVIVTHYDRDHAGGVAYLLSRVPADTVYLPDAVDDSEILDQLLPYCGGAEIFIRRDLTLSWADNELTVYAPLSSTSSNESGLSVLFRAEDHDILITGDMDALGEKLLVYQKQIPQVSVLVAGHHGSKSSTSEALLEATRPEYVFISVGEDNHYGHPNEVVLERLEAFGCTVYRTDENGTIIFRR
ncbi:MAG: DNA internalization-related competence protein ComEC/Rec2 [Oscillospiraceae bacterium]|nr:DNA internalization-related competence protein ComEC/Rec2 [Oscillospiraceae bacterium]